MDNSPTFSVSLNRKKPLKTYSRRPPLATIFHQNVFDSPESVEQLDPFDRLLKDYQRNQPPSVTTSDVVENDKEVSEDESINPYLQLSSFNFNDRTMPKKEIPKRAVCHLPREVAEENVRKPPYLDFSDAEKYSFIYSDDEIETPTSSDGVVKKKRKKKETSAEHEDVLCLNKDAVQPSDIECDLDLAKRKSDFTSLTTKETNLELNFLNSAEPLEMNNLTKSKQSDVMSWVDQLPSRIDTDDVSNSGESATSSASSVTDFYCKPATKTKIYTSTPLNVHGNSSHFKTMTKKPRVLTRSKSQNKSGRLNSSIGSTQYNLKKCYNVLKKIKQSEALNWKTPRRTPIRRTETTYLERGNASVHKPQSLDKIYLPLHLQIGKPPHKSHLKGTLMSTPGMPGHSLKNSLPKDSFYLGRLRSSMRIDTSLTTFENSKCLNAANESNHRTGNETNSTMRRHSHKPSVRKISLLPFTLEKIEYSPMVGGFISVLSSSRRRDQFKNSRTRRSMHSRLARPTPKSQKFGNSSVNKSHLESLLPSLHPNPKTDRHKVMEYCEQEEPVAFGTFIRKFTNIMKLGEGSYAEVFQLKPPKSDVNYALKIIPIEGHFLVNEAEQKTFVTILPEIAISMELNELNKNPANRTSNFIHVAKIACLKGKYPKKLLTAWDNYAEASGSENDRPDVFNNDQLYIAFQFANGGVDLEHFKLTNYLEALSVFLQTAVTLAVAENAVMFEHRDLHWGNILVKPIKEEKIEYVLRNNPIHLPSNGVFVTIIDFTLSSLNAGGVLVSSDLSKEPDIFTGDENIDYQFEVYRQMKTHTKGNWEGFHPYTNVLWLRYLLRKLIHQKTYANKRRHRDAFELLEGWEISVLSFCSTTEFVEWLKMEHGNMFEP